MPQERFGEILIRLGKIGAEEFNAVVREVAEGKRLGETLVERGYISTMDLYVGLNYQVQHILYSVFDWDFGLYEFEEEIRNVQQEIAVRVSTPDLVVRGVRNITNLTVLDRSVGDESRDSFASRNTANSPYRFRLSGRNDSVVCGWQIEYSADQKSFKVDTA